jgi:hypothetical protein
LNDIPGELLILDTVGIEYRHLVETQTLKLSIKRVNLFCVPQILLHQLSGLLHVGERFKELQFPLDEIGIVDY